MNTIKTISKILTVGLLFTSVNVMAQDDLLADLEKNSSKRKRFELPAFKSMQIGNLQSTKIASKGDLYLVVSHRFGSIKDGVDGFFGLDQANTKIQFNYGLFNGVQLGVSRDSYQKAYSGNVKFKITRQTRKFPVNIVGYGNIDVNTLLKKETYPNLRFTERLSYTSQLLISKRFSKKMSLLIAPTFVRKNLQNLNLSKEPTFNQLVLGVGGRFKVSKRMSLNIDYAYNFSKAETSVFKNPLTVGVDVETGGHIFQMFFTNSRGSHDAAYLTEAQGDWAKGDVSFGFNVVRVF
ncbi:MAG: DUF5777 family beta-barrel protein [Flavobacteriales bacterium]|jgi:hypothetical protein|nr:DUF5777 family beta-barrel protein [Flavobacteriales bacterium]